jgi:hypothetical protein
MCDYVLSAIYILLQCLCTRLNYNINPVHLDPNKEAACSAEQLVSIYKTTWHSNTEDINLIIYKFYME